MVREIAEDVIRYYTNNYLTVPVKRMAEHFNVSEGVVLRRLKRLGLKRPPEVIEKFKRDSRFKKGTVSANTGKKQTDFMSKETIERSIATRFKKGQKPKNTLKDNDITIRIDQRGALVKWIRLKESVWQMLHVYKWLKAGNVIPKGSMLTFKDHDTLNSEVSNMELITRGQLAIRNRWGNKENNNSKYPSVDDKVAVKHQKRLAKRERKQIMKREEKRIIKQKELDKIANSRVSMKKMQRKKASQIKIYEKERKRREEYRYEDKQVDYAQMIHVRIDHRTVICVKPGTDIEKLKQKYLKK